MNYLFCFNVDDYHSIHGWRDPATTTLSTAIHMATCVSKKIEYGAVPSIYNGIHIHNPNNIEAHKINYHLIHKFKGIFDYSYNVRKMSWNSSSLQNLNEFDRVELLTIHFYNALIAERQNDRSMKGTRIVNIQQKDLHSLNDYIEVLLSISKIENLSNYLKNNIIPVVADWPGQLFIRKAITKLQNQGLNNIIKNFVPLIGPLHVSLNSREQVVLIHWEFFNKMFHSIFGPNKVLAQKPKPWRINLLLDLADKGWKKISSVILNKFPNNCKDIEYRMVIDLLDNLIPATLDIYAILFRSGSFNEYLETLFRIWTFTLRWKRKNYNKAPLAFLSDYFYWKENNHLFADVIESHLVNFNDYYVENIHSQIRANTTSLDSANAIIEQTYVLDLHDQTTINTFKNHHKYPYTKPDLEELTTRASIFILDYFHSIYLNLGKSKAYNKKSKTHKLVTLNKVVDLRSLPAGYHTSFPPSPNSCDHCKNILENSTEIIVLICGHGYHHECYEKLRNRCKHCEEYYKKGIFENVDSFLKRLNGGDDILTEDDVEELNEDNEDEDNGELITPETNLTIDLNKEIELVESW
jgi:hypothetical protein